MLKPHFFHSEPDQTMLDRLAPVKRICLLMAGLVAFLILMAWFFPPLGNFLPVGWQWMKATTALALCLTALSLQLSDTGFSPRTHQFTRILGMLVALTGAVFLSEYAFQISFGLDTLLPYDHSASIFPGRLAPQTAGALFLAGMSIVLIRPRERFGTAVADVLVILQGFLVYVVLCGEIFGALRLFGISTSINTSPQTIFCLILITAVTLMRRAERGIFSIFLRPGMGGRIARVLAPILLVLPIAREIGRARMIHARMIPEHYATAILASIATVLSIVLLMALVWGINGMEMEIRELSLRDELTGLYNLRGFTLLGEHALRVALRSQLPISVLFVDLDNLKKINDTLGHETGSSFLVETATLLKETFRETDVIGRIGGDEFAVICQGSHVAVSIAAQRLHLASKTHNAEGRRIPLSLSIGFVTAEEHGHQSLQELLTVADRAMYEDKRRKKVDRA